MSEEGHSIPGSPTHYRTPLALLVVLVVALATYSYHQHRLTKQLRAENRDIASSLNTTQAQIDALTARINTLAVDQSATKTSPPASQASGSPQHPKAGKRTVARRHRADDPRWKQFQGRLDEQGRQIESTRQDLASARAELSGSIARTHDELVLLEKKGQRSYYEFDLDKNGQFQHKGPVGVRLRKANAKHQYADLELMVDDFKLSKKHVNIYEPVVFYAGNDQQPVELVINSVDKNHIHGYVSEPKYKASDLQAISAGNGTDAGSSTNAAGTSSAQPAPISRRRLELPKSDTSSN
jgi:hypothetical protein